MDQFANRFRNPAFVHRAVYLSLFGYWIFVIVRNRWTAWMLGR